jgi:RNA polymerase-binding transcription factor DksA
MSPTELEVYRKRLLNLMKRLGQDVSQLEAEGRQGVGGEASGGLSDVPVHLADLASHATEEDVTLRLLDSEQQGLADVAAAWERLEKGTFGRCEACQQEIARERLQALPYTRYCSACAHKLQEK